MKQLAIECKDVQRKTLHTAALQLKSIDAATGTFEGYAAAFNNVDHGGDIILPGAFADSLLERPANKVRVLWNHSSGEPIGVTLSAVEDSYGLLVKGQLVLEVQRARETLALVKAEGIGGLSIGFIPTEWSYDKDMRILRKVHLIEYSFVTFPMNENATILDAKSLPEEATVRDCEIYLRDARGFSRSDAKALIARIRGAREAAPEVDETKALRDRLVNIANNIDKG